MIKLTNVEITNNFDTKEEKIFLSKSEIGRMSRDKSENFTYITMKNNDFPSYSVKETPEEILAMPDIETTEKVIDWEQRRFDVICQLFVRFYPISQDCLPYFLGDILPRVDALINELKKGDKK